MFTPESQRGRVNADTLPKYVLFWLLSPKGRTAIQAVASSSSGLYTLSLSKIEGLPLPICDTSEQAEIVRRIELALSWINRLAEEAANARKLIDHLNPAILGKAFRGKLVPQDPSDESASVLLERIRAGDHVTDALPSSKEQSKAPRLRKRVPSRR